MLSLHNMFGNMFFKKIIKNVPTCLTTVALSALIAYLSLDSNPFDVNRVKLFEGADKLVHCIMYFCLSVVCIFDCAKVFYPNRLKTLLVVLCACIAFMFSMLMELLQGVMEIGRAASLGDMIANLIGTLGGLFFMKYYFLKRFNDIMRS